MAPTDSKHPTPAVLIVEADGRRADEPHTTPLTSSCANAPARTPAVSRAPAPSPSISATDGLEVTVSILWAGGHTAQRTFFGLIELVEEVVGYLSSSRQEVVKCLYISKNFHSAALPLVYKYIPLHYHNVVNPTLKKKYLQAVVAPTIESCRRFHTITSVAHYPILFEAPIEGHEYSIGWASISKLPTELLVHISSECPHYVGDLIDLLTGSYPSSIAALSGGAIKTVTLVLVPSYIGSQDIDWESVSPYEWGMGVRDLDSDLALRMVGLEFCDPSSQRSRWKGVDLKSKFSAALDKYLEDEEDWEYHPYTLDQYKHRLMSGIQYMTFKDYLETTGEWTKILNWRTVGEWLNKYYERESESATEDGQHEADADLSNMEWSSQENPGALAHLPRATFFGRRVGGQER